jgi:hypothetical protein
MNITKIYISLPVTSRPEPTLSERLSNAFARSAELRRMVYGMHEHRNVHLLTITPFDIAPIGTEKTEAQIMSECVKAVLEADICVFDKDWRTSKGCRVEHTAASLYGKEIIDLSKQ